ncbi:hypothetical protein HY025_03865 [Candidatus Daviesbacteria bacterium]|nr:hypothetical protein [Candidatus Daviesbacteria bacterium]
MVKDAKRLPYSRTVYFSANLSLSGNKEIYINQAYFFLNSRAEQSAIDLIQQQLPKSNELGGYPFQAVFTKDKKYPGFARSQIQIGLPTPFDKQTIKRRLKGKPRLRIDPPKLIEASENYNLAKFAPFVVYIGSGLSAESGLPLLGTIHKVFEVDDFDKQELVFGAQDGLPARLVKDVNLEFKSFCQFSVDAIKAPPSKSHLDIGRLYKTGTIVQVFTDNIDDILRKVNVPFTQVRISIFPERYSANFHPKARSLLVIGIAVDRRQIIKQARRKGLNIIAINPVLRVAPHSRNMDYLSKGDILFKQTANNVLPKIIAESNFK